jgi:hypothetical protein
MSSRVVASARDESAETAAPNATQWSKSRSVRNAACAARKRGSSGATAAIVSSSET